MTLFYEDLEVGQVFHTAARTVTETDLTVFSMLSGDWNPIHSDAEFASDTFYGQRVVHGLFGISLLTGLMERAGWFSESALALLDIERWAFRKPIFVGDTLRAEMEIVSKRMTSAGDRGVVGRRFTLLNQRDEVVQTGDLGMMIRLTPEVTALAPRATR
ncbi:MAG: MaoC family dehydratase N-terminal domain-containing protein [Actinomycetota bacterium]|nr:MaoC family dehydratase N-terminal domain-containing protein [Actinomycetota bacterium]